MHVCVNETAWTHTHTHTRSRARAQLVAVEMGGEPLEGFEHPDRAVYLLGNEATGLADSVMRAAQHHVALPSVRYESYNVAVAGSIVLYDRLAKQQNRGGTCSDK